MASQRMIPVETEAFCAVKPSAMQSQYDHCEVHVDVKVLPMSFTYLQIIKEEDVSKGNTIVIKNQVKFQYDPDELGDDRLKNSMEQDDF